MKVIIDDKIPYIKGVLEPFAKVEYLPGKLTTAEIVKDADAIITRTRTKCNAAILEGSSVKMIATATIGYDHIDTDYCKKTGIEWKNAPGCNSWSVNQYIMAALHTLAKAKNLTLSDLTIGIIGAGNVGSKVARSCEIIGMNVLVNDPPRQRKEGNAGFSSLAEIQKKADIITFHTPLTRKGIDKTFHQANEKFISNCKEGLIFINASRGEVMDTEAIKKALNSEQIAEAIIDCWENEPTIDLDLLNKAFITTPHIAGYSKDGKANGTSMSVQAISRKFRLGIDDWQCNNVELPPVTEFSIDGKDKSEQQIISEAILFTYPILEDTAQLKKSPDTFEKQRGDYPVRREFPVFTIHPKNVSDDTISKFKKLGFKIEV